MISWPIILNLLVRRQVGAEIRNNFLATLANTESNFFMAVTDKCILNHVRLRCDRNHPCGACARRGLSNSCNYAVVSAVTTPSSSTLNAQQIVAPRQSTSLHDRLSELEKLVVTLMNGQSRPNLLEPIPDIRRPRDLLDEAATPKDPGTLNLHEAGASYVQSEHWEAVLTKVRGLRGELITVNHTLPGSNLFYGPNRHATREEILAAVPSRSVVDRLMALHFDSYILTPCQ